MSIERYHSVPSQEHQEDDSERLQVEHHAAPVTGERRRRFLGRTTLIATLGIGTASWLMLSGQVEAEEDSCSDIRHQQIAIESSLPANVRSALNLDDATSQTAADVSDQLSDQRGYHISEARLLHTNQASEIFTDDEIASGVYCVEVPGPVYAGLKSTETDDSLHSIAEAHGISVKTLRAYNPPLKKWPAKEPLDAGLVLRVDERVDTGYIYREMTDSEANIATMTAGKPRLRRQLLAKNEANISTGSSLEAGSLAWLPPRPTEWLRDIDEDMSGADMRKAYRRAYRPGQYQKELSDALQSSDSDEVTTIQAGSTIEKFANTPRHVSVAATDHLTERGPEWRNRAVALRFFIDQGFEDYQAAGLIGNFVVESGGEKLPPAVKQFSGGPGRGIAQWEKGARFDELERFARRHGSSWTDLEIQLRFVMHEFQTTEKRAFHWLNNTKNVEQAAHAVLNGYERPAARILGPRHDAAQAVLSPYRRLIRSKGLIS